jgi:DNA polymerase III delta subunit
MKKSKEKPEIILSGISKTIGDLFLIKTMLGDGYSLDYIAKKLAYHSYKVTLYAKSASKTDINVLKSLNERCYEADLLIKSTSADPYTVLERLAVEASRR